MKKQEEEYIFQVPEPQEDVTEEDGIMVFPDDDYEDGELRELNFD